MHTIKFTQRFLANQPWKNPHGENQSERGEIFIIFFSKIKGQKYRRNTTYLHHRLYPKVWTLCSANQPYTLSRFLCQLKCRPYNSEKIVPATINAPYSLDFCAVINVVRTAINAARTVNKTSISVQEECLENSAEVNAAVQQE